MPAATSLGAAARPEDGAGDGDEPVAVAERRAAHEDEEKRREGGGGAGRGSELPLAVGLRLDVRDTVKIWSVGEVVELHDDQVKVHYQYWDHKWDEYIPRDSHRLAALGTHTYLAGGVLRAGQRVDAKDTYNKWMEARVVEVTDSQVQIHYKGWAKKWDEWLPLSSARIAPFGEKSRVKPKPKPRPRTDYWKAHARKRAITRVDPRHTRYVAALRDRGLRVQSVDGDGNCLFRSVAHQVYGDDSLHALVRSKCMDYMEAEKEYFEPYVVGDMDEFLRYLSFKRRLGCWGDDPEIQAMCELYDRPAEIYAFDAERGAALLRTFHEARADRRPPIRLSYYGGGHYDSIVSDEHEEHLLASEPGEVEDKKLELIALRGSLRPAAELSDREATEAQAMEAAMKASREVFDARNNLDMALLRSLDELLAGGGDVDIEDVKRESELSSMQLELLERAKRESEEEQLRAAMEESFSTAADPELSAVLARSAAEASDDELIRSALEASRAESLDPELEAALAASRMAAGMGGEDVDPELWAVLQASTMDGAGGDAVDAAAGGGGEGGVDAAAMEQMRILEAIREQELQAVLEASRREAEES